MGRMHSKGKGMSSSALPYKRSKPSWLKTTSEEVGWGPERWQQASWHGLRRAASIGLAHRMRHARHPNVSAHAS